MATVINNPNSGDDGVGAGMIVGIILVVIIVALLLIYGIPALRNNSGATYSNTYSNTTYTAPGTPADTAGGTNTNVNVTVPMPSANGSTGTGTNSK